MNVQRAGVYCEGSDVMSLLRDACPDWTFIPDGEARDACRLAIVDAARGRPPGKSIVRIVLCDDPPGNERGNGELRLHRDAFLRAPAGYLAFASDLVGAALHAAELELEAAHLRQIHDLMTLVDAEAVSERITTAVLALLGLDRGTLLLHDPRLERYVVSFSSDPAYAETGEFLPGIPPDLLQQAITSSELYAVSRSPTGEGRIVIPLQTGDDLIGVIQVPLASGDAIDEQASGSMTTFLAAVMQVLSNVYQLTRSRDLALRDDLTKAYNRRFFDTYLDEEIERSRRYGTIFTIIFLDLDDLKTVNNAYGHLSGSRTLQEVAKRILGAVRTIDKVVRFGGDEFCVILPQTDQEQAVAVANRIARAISSSPLAIDASIEVNITASFGIATYPAHALTKDALIRQADEAMYRVKSTTKNAVGLAEVADATKPLV